MHGRGKRLTLLGATEINALPLQIDAIDTPLDLEGLLRAWSLVGEYQYDRLNMSGIAADQKVAFIKFQKPYAFIVERNCWYLGTSKNP
jgi:hypothetical protein